MKLKLPLDIRYFFEIVSVTKHEMKYSNRLFVHEFPFPYIMEILLDTQRKQHDQYFIHFKTPKMLNHLSSIRSSSNYTCGGGILLYLTNYIMKIIKLSSR